MGDVQIHELRSMDLRGAIVVDGFPSVGLVSSIVANYLVEVLGLEEVGLMDSPHFPTVALVKGGVPLHPVRIYGGGTRDRKVVVFLSEFQPAPGMVREIAQAVMDWAQARGCALLVCPEALIVEAPQEPVRVYGVGSSPAADERLRDHGVEIFEEGVITGVVGVLLNEGRKRGFDVISVLAEAHPDIPDARAAARVLETVDRLVLEMGLDTQPLYDEAGRIEGQLRTIHRQALEARQPEGPRTSMYG